VREATVADGEVLSLWLGTQVLISTHRLDHVREALYQRCRDIRLEPPTPDRVERLIRSALHQFETQLGERVLYRLSPSTRTKLDALLVTNTSTEEEPQHPGHPNPARPYYMNCGRIRSCESGESLARNGQIGACARPGRAPGSL
jgi:hypothetical protein